MSRRSRFSVPDFRRRKGSGPPLVVLTAYDAVSTSVAEAAGVDAILVGDSLANVLLGHPTTMQVDRGATCCTTPAPSVAADSTHC